MTTLGGPRGQGRTGGSVTNDIAEKAGEFLGVGSSARAVNLGSPNALSKRAIEAEQALLGCVLIDDFEVWGELEEFPLEAEDFLAREHKALWRAFRWLCEQGLEVTMPSTVRALEHLQLIDSVDQWLHPLAGAEVYLVELMNATYSAKGCDSFLRVVKHYSDMRAPLNARTTRETAI